MKKIFWEGFIKISAFPGPEILKSGKDCSRDMLRGWHSGFFYMKFTIPQSRLTA